MAYTLKKHTSKLKNRGMDPYIIHNLSTNGVVHLATLDEGEPVVANWISGCRLKKNHKPLTPKILERLHATKQWKQNKENMKQEAIVKAKERVMKLRRRRQYM